MLIDDSIVRGTTSRRIIRILREAGAKEVHLRIASPPLKWPCFYGVDIATKRELISSRKGPEALGSWLEADSLGFLDVSDLERIYGRDKCCYACFNGIYVTELFDHAPEADESL